MTYKTLLVEIRQGVGVIWMNRPERQNALDATMIKELEEAFSLLDADQEVRIVVLAGAGACFCAGADRERLQELAENSLEKNRLDAMSLAKLLQTIHNLSKPTLARVTGFAVNGGAALVAACDMAVSDYNAEFGLSDLRFGLLPTTIVPYLLKAVGERTARHWFLSGELFAAAEAYRTGLLTDITPAEELDARINELIGKIIQGAPNAQACLKDWLRSTAGGPITPGLCENSALRFANACAGEEFQRGLADLLAKRKPHWLLKKKKAASKTNRPQNEKKPKAAIKPGRK
ncbi:MAG: enoyl-CoA hydratase-related protein [Syntrophales bacterium]